MITVESIEKLANKLVEEREQAREKLVRLIRAEARVLYGRNPDKFECRPTEWRDEEGHWDNSYPPSQDYYTYTGPRAVVLVRHESEEVPTSGGYYYDWKLVPKDPGIAVGPDGILYGCDVTGTGRVGQFAAHPGDCGVEAELNWYRLNPADIPLKDLQLAEQALRVLAFPAAAAA